MREPAIKRLRRKLRPKTRKKPPPQWMASHAKRCIAEAADLLGARDALRVDTYDLFDGFPRPNLLATVAEGLRIRGIGIEPDPYFSGPTIAPYDATRRLRRRSSVVLFPLLEASTPAEIALESIRLARLALHVAISVFVRDEEVKIAPEVAAAIEHALASVMQVRAREWHRLRMYNRWLEKDRPPLDERLPELKKLGTVPGYRVRSFLAQVLARLSSGAPERSAEAARRIESLFEKAALATAPPPPARQPARSISPRRPEATAQVPLDRKTLRLHSSHAPAVRRARRW